MSFVRLANQSSQLCAVKRSLPVLVLAIFCGVSAFGQVAIWSGGVGDWFLPPNHPSLELPNWSCLCEPNGPGFSVNIGTYTGTGGITGTVTLNMPANVAGVSLGNGSSGELDVVNGNTLMASNVVVVGTTAAGTLNINSGGVVNDVNGTIASLSGATGTATVSGSGSQWNHSGVLTVGLTGQGSLTISSTGVVSSTGLLAGTSVGASVGGDAGSSGNVLVTGHGSRLNITNVLAVGYHGDGTLTVGAGATGSSVVLDIGTYGRAAGTVTLTDAGTFWNAGNAVIVGDLGTGALAVQNGALVSGDLGYVGADPGSSGRVMVTGVGSTWSNAGALDIGTQGTGAVTINNGGTVVAATITIGTLGSVDAKGGTLTGTVINHGTLDPLGTIKVNGDYTQGVDGTLILDVAGTGAGSFGQLDVSGNATFGGTIDFDFIDGFAPSMDDSFDFINVGGSADFSGATIDIGGLLPGFNYTHSFQNGQFILTVLNTGTSANSTPEPASFLLFGTALLALWLIWRRRSRVLGCRENGL